MVGTSCSGKTTFASSLAAALRAPHVELDALYWGPGWRECPRGEFRARVERATSGDRWVTDGNYSVVRDIVWGQATDVCWLDLPRPLVFRRAMTRTIVRAATREVIFSGNRESFRTSFLSRESILLWVLGTWSRNRRKYADLMRSDEWRHLRFHRFGVSSEADTFLRREAGWPC